MIILITIFVYFGILFLVSRLVGRDSNDAFFRGERRSPWPIVAFGMIGASLSGVTFVSVPGMVLTSDMTYLQMCLGFIVGYFIIALVLLPLYYKHNLTSIYSYLGERFGSTSRKTGSYFFLLSKMMGASARLYLVCVILQEYAFNGQFEIGGTKVKLPFVSVVFITLLLIWLYTRKSGIKTIVWTDSLQTLCLILALILIFIQVANTMEISVSEAFSRVFEDSRSRIWEFDDWQSKQHFIKQFMSGAFIAIVMTGLDQDMMQKNLSCKNLRSGQKNLCSYGVMFFPVNLLFLSLGILLTLFYATNSMSLPDKGDNLLPEIISTGLLGKSILVFFTIGVIASAFSSADSALTALTTSYCIDILEVENPASKHSTHPEKTRKIVHIGMTFLFVVFILLFKSFSSNSVIDAIYVIAGYTYGPLLGMFAFGLLTKRMPNNKLVPFIAITSPIISYIINLVIHSLTGYEFGYELLMMNGLLTYIGLWCSSKSIPRKKEDSIKGK